MNASIDELIEVDGIGTVSATKIREILDAETFNHLTNQPLDVMRKGQTET
jgi:ERCC4-type nuclease